MTKKRIKGTQDWRSSPYSTTTQQRRLPVDRLATWIGMTGLIVAAASGMADVLGFGSHPVGLQVGERPLLGTWQATGVLGGFLIAAAGVLIFALMGHPEPPEETSVSAAEGEQTAAANEINSR